MRRNDGKTARLQILRNGYRFVGELLKRYVWMHLKSLFSSFNTFSGGVYLPADEVLPAGMSIDPFPHPERLTVPLLQHAGTACESVVEVDQQVSVGQLIGQAKHHNAVNVHAPLAGRVTAITHVATALHPEVPAIQIDTTNDEQLTSKKSDGTKLDLDGLVALADDAGIVNVCDPAVGLSEQLRRVSSGQIRDVIINGMNFEPILSGRRELLWHSLDAMIFAGVQVRDALGARYLRLAIDESDRRLVALCREATQRTPVRIATLRNKYPQAKPALLTWAVTGRKPTYGKGPESAQTLVLELEPIIALAKALRDGQPMLDRVVTVAGPALRRGGHYRIPVGTSFADVLRHVGLNRPVNRLIEGGHLTGRTVATLEAVVTKQTSAIIAIDSGHEHIPVPGPCLRCGWCQDICPVGLDPLALLDAFERSDFERVRRLYPEACLECGLCSYVCPADLPLTEAASGMKRAATIDTTKQMEMIDQQS